MTIFNVSTIATAGRRAMPTTVTLNMIAFIDLEPALSQPRRGRLSLRGLVCGLLYRGKNDPEIFCTYSYGWFSRLKAGKQSHRIFCRFLPVVAATGQAVTVARRPPRRAGRVLAGKGNGWELWVPVDQWARMTAAARVELVERQRTLLEK